MKKSFIFGLMLITATMGKAESFKVGPASSSDKMDFANINAAMASSSVRNGDTLWLDKNYYETSTQTVNKGVTIIGTGYDIDQTNEGVVAYLYCTISLKSDNITLKSTKCNTVEFYNNNCIVDRCFISYVQTQDASAGANTVRSSYITGYIWGYTSTPYSTINLYNNVVNSSYKNYGIVGYISNSDIQYNTIIFRDNNGYYPMYYVNNSSIKNNIILHISTYYTNNVFSSCSDNSIDHNILSMGSWSEFPENRFGYGNSSSSLFTCEGNYSDYYKLASASAAKGYATDGGEVGCHGGMFGNPAGGRPQYVPYFEKIEVGSKSTDGKLPVSVSVKIQND